MIRRSGSFPGYRPLNCARIFLIGLMATATLFAQPGPEQKVIALDADNFDRFGASVDIFGNFAVIGAPGDDEAANGAGAAYVFQYDGTWTQIQKLMASDAQASDEFGFDVSVERNLIAVGARWEDEAAVDAGAVYLFQFNGTVWEQTEKFLPSPVSPSAHSFGTSVDLGISIPDEGVNPEQTNLAVGAPLAESSRGTAYLFLRQNETDWTEVLRFEPEATPPSTAQCANLGGHLGTSIAIRGDSLLAGAPVDDQHGSNSGSACHFGRGQIVTSWAAASRPGSPTTGGDTFGSSVAVDKFFDEYIQVYGAPHASATADGKILIIDNGGEHTLTVVDADDFGKAVAIEQRQVVVGAPKDDTGAQDSGVIYFFDRDDVGVWSAAGTLQASDSANEKQFGAAVAYRHSSLIVGSPEEGQIPGPGAAYIYTSLIFADGFESGDLTAW